MFRERERREKKNVRETGGSSDGGAGSGAKRTCSSKATKWNGRSTLLVPLLAKKGRKEKTRRGGRERAKQRLVRMKGRRRKKETKEDNDRAKTSKMRVVLNRKRGRSERTAAPLAK